MPGGLGALERLLWWRGHGRSGRDWGLLRDGAVLSSCCLCSSTWTVYGVLDAVCAPQQKPSVTQDIPGRQKGTRPVYLVRMGTGGC